MCEFCDKTKETPQYLRLIEEMLSTDAKRLENTKTPQAISAFSSAGKNVFSTVNLPSKIEHPLFEPRAAYAVPNNYYQPLVVNGEQTGRSFAHGATRSIFFSGKYLMLLSKTVTHTEGFEFFTSYLLAHFEKKELRVNIAGGNGNDGHGEDASFEIAADVEKPAKNLVSGKTEKIRIQFNFIHQPVKNRIVSSERVMSSTQLKNAYGKYGAGLGTKMASVDMEGYAITVPHFAPHPYLLQLHNEFGFGSPKEMQERASEYFKTHLIL
ncbi:TPA: hypothetical protein HA238_02425 [Candidatus Micrarchaeota archaeon]|nr:hypothetical protein [Candidatus Micrarchaeota archaeon]